MPRPHRDLLLAAATGLAGEQATTCSHAAVRAALAAHPTIGGEQTAVVRDITQGGAGVAVVVGRPGTSETFTLGSPGMLGSWMANGSSARLPTGIATMCLGAYGFEDVATVDGLLGELDTSPAAHRGPDRGRGDPALLDARTVLL